MTRIGLLSDTHGELDPGLWQYLKDCDEIWHAGDFGGIEVANELRSRGQLLRAVFGNIDDDAVRDAFPEHLRFECQQLRVWMTHIGGTPNRFPSRLRNMLRADPPQLLVCGHSHVLYVGRDKKLDNMLVLNPGAAGHQGFHTLRTMLRFEIDGDRIDRLQAMELGPRGGSAAPNSVS